MLKVFIAFPLMLLSVGCASIFDQAPPEERVATRSQERLDLLMAGDIGGAYEYTTPGYRTAQDVRRYGARWAGAAMWMSASVHQVTCSGGEVSEVCKATVKVTYRRPPHAVTDTFLFEEWILIDGEWFIYQPLGE